MELNCTATCNIVSLLVIFFQTVLGSSKLANLDPCPSLTLRSEKTDIGNVWSEKGYQVITIEQSSMTAELVNFRRTRSQHSIWVDTYKLDIGGGRYRTFYTMFVVDYNWNTGKYFLIGQIVASSNRITLIGVRDEDYLHISAPINISMCNDKVFEKRRGGQVFRGSFTLTKHWADGTTSALCSVYGRRLLKIRLIEPDQCAQYSWESAL